MNWLKKWRIARLEVYLAGAVAQDRVMRELTNATGTAFPMALRRHAREVAEIEEKLKQLKEKK